VAQGSGEKGGGVNSWRKSLTVEISASLFLVAIRIEGVHGEGKKRLRGDRWTSN